MWIWLGLPAIFLAGMTQGCIGFGMAMVAAPALMLLMPPASLVPTITLISLANTFSVAWHARRHVRVAVVLPLMLGGACGVPLGIMLLKRANPEHLKMMVGVGVLLFSVALWRGWKWPVRRQDLALFPVGIVSGFLGTSTSISGPPVVLFLANQDTEKDAFRANLTAFFFLNACTALVGFAYSGLMSGTVIKQAIFLLPALLLGTLAGVYLSSRISEARFRRVVIIGIGAMGLVLVSLSILTD